MNIKEFSREWWFRFIEKNLSFTETQVYKNVLSKEFINTLNAGVFEMLQSRINRLDINNGFRLYANGKELSDSEIRKIIENNPLKKGMDIQTYCESTFGKNFGIITNYGEKHSEILAENILRSIKPLFDIYGIPPWGVELTTFIGDYGWTPLGIHTDNRGENVLHYHIGPGKKTMYVWDEEVYQTKGGGISNNTNIEPLLKYADKYEFESGDLYYMPWNKHHIGYSGEFSIGVTLWFNNPTRYDFSKLMIESVKNLFLKNDKSIIESQIDYLNNENTYSDFVNTLKINQQTLKAPLDDFLKQTYTEYKKCLISNGGWQNLPLNYYKKIDSDKVSFPDLKNKTLLLSDVYKNSYKVSGNRLYVYIRGSKLSFKYFPELVMILNLLDPSVTDKIEVRTILAKCPDLPEEVTLYFLKTMINHKGVKIQNFKLEDIYNE